MQLVPVDFPIQPVEFSQGFNSSQSVSTPIMPITMSDRLPCPKCYKWMPEHSLKNHWTHRKDHGEWNAFCERQEEPQAFEQRADIMLHGRVNRGLQGLDFDDDYDELQDEVIGEFGDDVFYDEYDGTDNTTFPPLHERMSGMETPESHLPTLEKHVETFSGAGISSHCLIDR
jgi:hypothetical protein